MADTKLALYTSGQGRTITVDHTGPASYPTGGETVGTVNVPDGIVVQGLSTIDMINVAGPTVSGNYAVIPQCTGTGNRKTWKLIWVTANSGIPTTTQVTNGTNLSAETVRTVYDGR